jgi:hypothetical protein
MRALLVLALAWCILCTCPRLVLAEPLWLDDTLVSQTAPGLNRVVIDARPDGSALYVHVSGDQVNERVGWYRSTDGGDSWASFWTATWGINNGVIGGAYGFDVLVNIWQAGTGLWRRTINADTGAQIGSGTIATTSAIVREIVVDSNAETGPSGEEHFIVCMTYLNPSNNQVSVAASRSDDNGATWSGFDLLDSGPTGAPDAIGDMHLTFARAGYPYFHVIYRKEGRLWHVRTTDAGVSWEAPTELILNVAATTEVSVAAFGIFAVAVAESPTGQVVYCNSTDAGATWSVAKLIDQAEIGGRWPFIVFRGAYQALYRQPDGRLVTRWTTTPENALSWSAEEYASVGTTAHSPWAVGGYYPGEVGVVYIRYDDDDRPYFVSRTGAPAAILDAAPEPPRVALDVFPTPSAGPFRFIWAAGPPPAAGEILDVAGHRVAPFPAWSPDGRGHLASWDGRDARGRPVAAGIYFARVATPGGVETARLVVVR